MVNILAKFSDETLQYWVSCLVTAGRTTLPSGTTLVEIVKELEARGAQATAKVK